MADRATKQELIEEQFYCDSCGKSMNDDEGIHDGNPTIICGECYTPVRYRTQPSQFMSTCDRCGEAESDANPVDGKWADRYSAYGDPEPPELTWLCNRCVESDEVIF